MANRIQGDEQFQLPGRAVFLDRDGVINHMVYDVEFGLVDSPANPDQFTLFEGIGAAIASLNCLGLLVIVVSNQPGIAKGKFNADLLEAMTDKMTAAIQGDGGKVDAIYYCLHHPQSSLPEYALKCGCRKPRPGLLLQAAKEWNIDLRQSYMVGDGITDVLAGQAAGATTLFVSSRKCYICDSLAEHNTEPDYMVADLVEAADLIQNIEYKNMNAAAAYKFGCKIN